MAGLITLAEYKIYKGISSDTKDTYYESAILEVSDWIRSYCGRQFNNRTSITEYFRGTESFYYLKEYPNTSILSVNTSTDGQNTQTSLDDGVDYFIEPETGLLETVDDTYFSSISKFRSLEVIYTGGYLTLPEDLKLATMNLVAYYAEKEYKPRLSTGVHNKDNINENNELPYYIQQTLDIYRNLNL